MTSYNCVLVDDEHPALSLLQAYAEKLPHLEIVASCENGVDALAALKSNTVDILLLDIQMPGLTGIELLKSLRSKPQIILTTAYRDFAVIGYELNVTDYLVKPFSFERFLQAIDKAIEQLKLQTKLVNLENANVISSDTTNKDPGDHFFVRTNHKMEKVIFDDILYIESMREYANIQTAKRRYVVNQSMIALEGSLPHTKFMRVHRSFIIALDHIDTIKGNLIVIGEKEITIGGSYRERFFDQLNTL